MDAMRPAANKMLNKKSDHPPTNTVNLDQSRRFSVIQSNVRPKLRRMRLPLIILAVTAAIIYFLVATRPEMVPVVAPERVWPVEVIEARIGTIQPELNLFGEVVAGRRTELLPLVTGVIVEMGENFVEGGQVRKGELLLQIDPFDYETGLAEQGSMLKESRVKLTMLKRDLERANELFAANNVSEQFLDSAELDVLQQEAIVEQREIGVRRAERDLADTRLVAPFDGVVTDLNADTGGQVAEGIALVRIVAEDAA